MKAIAAAMVVVVITLTYGNPIDPEGATRLLSKVGYSAIMIEGLSWTCSRWNAKRTAFRATAPNGKTVHGSVCRTVTGAESIEIS